MIFRLALLLVALSLPALNQAESHALQRALGLFNSGKYDECLALVSAYLRQNPNSATAHYFFAFVLLVPEKRLNQALDEFQTALSLDPLSTIVNVNQAATLMAAPQTRCTTARPATA